MIRITRTAAGSYDVEGTPYSIRQQGGEWHLCWYNVSEGIYHTLRDTKLEITGLVERGEARGYPKSIHAWLESDADEPVEVLRDCV